MKKLLLLVAVALVACNTKNKKESFEYKRPNPNSLKYTNQPILKKREAVVVENDLSNKGIGPVKEYTPGEINSDWITLGEALFKSKCTACHKIGKKFIGPNLVGLQDRRSPEWSLNMMINPTEMLDKDPIAKQLLLEANGAPMADQGLTEEDAKHLFEYIRSIKQ